MSRDIYVDADGYSWTPYLVMRCEGCGYAMPHLVRSDGQYVMCAWCKHVDELHVDTYARRIS